MKAIDPEPSANDTRTAIDRILSEQSKLSAVEHFSIWHGEGHRPLLEPQYRRLIPLTTPKPGEQYAFDVDLDRCSGCKACVSACHSLNGLDEEETWRSVGLVESVDWSKPQRQFVTTACHHCVDPGCLNGCPVLAYDKDAITGIVRHLDDQCIGCSYCLMTCPYEVPRYSKRRGIVRKCDMCQDRLADGEAPACVQACPNEAIRISIVSQEDLMARYRPEPNGVPDGSNAFLPHSPDPAITVATTQYRSVVSGRDGFLPVHRDRLFPADSHHPLAILLLLTQMSVGLQIAGAVTGVRGLLIASLGAACVGLAAGLTHLGQPLRAWRAFLGWRRSWFSREVIGFGGYVGMGSLACVWPVMAWPAAGVGLLSVGTSVMIYVATVRKFWSFPLTAFRFFGTCGITATAALWIQSGNVMWALPMGLMAVGKLLVEFGAVSALQNLPQSDLATGLESGAALNEIQRSGRILIGPLQTHLLLRLGTALSGGVALPAICLIAPNWMGWAALALAALLLSEILERHLFFRAVSPTRMPGGAQ